MAQPIYWDQLNWNAGWGGKPLQQGLRVWNEEGTAFEMVGKEHVDVSPLPTLQLAGAMEQSGDYASTFLEPTSEPFKAIETYLKANANARSIRAPQGERTRMAWAKKELDDELKKGDAKQEARIRTYLNTLLEKPSMARPYAELYKTYNIPMKKTKPPRTGGVAITGIKVIKNEARWNEYDEARIELAKELKDNDNALTTGGKLWGRNALQFTTTYRCRDSGLTGGELNLPVLDQKIGEVLLMHGTSENVCKIIAGQGFDPTFNKGETTGNVTKYGALGQGTYFGDSFAKVQTYIKCPVCMAMQCDCQVDDEPVDRLLILARCLLGVPTKARTHDSHRQEDASTIKAGKHSVVGQEGIFSGNTTTASLFGSNEFLVKDRSRMYPEFIVYWRPI